MKFGIKELFSNKKPGKNELGSVSEVDNREPQVPVRAQELQAQINLQMTSLEKSIINEIENLDLEKKEQFMKDIDNVMERILNTFVEMKKDGEIEMFNQSFERLNKDMERLRIMLKKDNNSVGNETYAIIKDYQLKIEELINQ